MSYLTDEKVRRRMKNRRVLVVVLLLVLLLVALAPVAWYVNRHIQATTVFREAKDTRLAIRLLSTQYSAMNQPMNDLSQENGFSPGTAEDICATAQAAGTLRLIAWDEAQNVPIQYIYTRAETMVTYTYDPATGTEHWLTVTLVPMLDFTL